MLSAALTMSSKRSFSIGMACSTNGWSRLYANIMRRRIPNHRLRMSCDGLWNSRHVMTLPIIIQDIRDRDLSLNVVVLATKAKAGPERARSKAPALTHLPNILVDHASGDFLRRKIKPRLNALEI